MDALFAMLGFLGLGVAIVMLIVKGVLKKGWPYKNIGILAGAALLLVIIGFAVSPATENGPDADRDAALQTGRQVEQQRDQKEQVIVETPNESESQAIFADKEDRNTGAVNTISPEEKQDIEGFATGTPENLIKQEDKKTDPPSEIITQDDMLNELKERVTSNVKEAAGGKFDKEKTPTISFDPHSGIVQIKARASDNLTKSLIRKGIVRDIASTLQDVSLDEKGFDYEVGGENIPVCGVETVDFVITFSLIDAYGKESEGLILNATYSRKTLESIVWENVYRIDFEKIADYFWVSPSLDK